MYLFEITCHIVSQIRGRPDIEIDAEETSVSNWVRYINCARNYIERNLIAMQIQNEIFYVTNTEIERFVFISYLLFLLLLWLITIFFSKEIDK